MPLEDGSPLAAGYISETVACVGNFCVSEPALFYNKSEM
jgi:hypothetical protein